MKRGDLGDPSIPGCKCTYLGPTEGWDPDTCPISEHSGFTSDPKKHRQPCECHACYMARQKK